MKLRQASQRAANRTVPHRRPTNTEKRTLEYLTDAEIAELKARPHMLRHGCGFALANKDRDTRALQAYLGHRNIQRTARYTELAPDRFKDFSR